MERDRKERAKYEAKYRYGPVDAKEQFDKDYSGYSEAQTDLNNEIHAGEWQSLSRFKTYRNRSRQGKILATHQAVSNRLRELEKMYYALIRDNPTKGERLLHQIKQLRLVQDVLLQCLVWEPAGKLDKSMVPPEVWELIK
jgi:hypothetical protein